jgi:hypothetical protein
MADQTAWSEQNQLLRQGVLDGAHDGTSPGVSEGMSEGEVDVPELGDPDL